MTLRFQADADFNHKIVSALRRREPAIDFLDAHQGGVIGVSDYEVLRIAADLGRLVVSHDRRTMPAHLVRFVRTRSSAGLIIVQQGLDIGAAVEDLLLICALTDAAEWYNQIGYVPI
jgi:hypothetical protein